MKYTTLIFCAVFLFFGLSGKVSATTTRYIRTDGNDTNCTGLVDAAYPGSGSAQPCAWTTLDYTLTSSHISYGDTVIIDAGTYTPTARINSSIGGTYSSQTTTIRAKTGDAVYMNIPAGCLSPLIIVKPGFLLQHLNFTNTNSVAINWLNLYVTGTYTIQDSTFDGNNAATGVATLNADSSTITFVRNQVKNLSSSLNYAIGITSHTGDTAQVYSSLFNNSAIITITSSDTNMNVDLRNNTVFGVSSAAGNYPISLNNVNTTSVGAFSMYNNIIETSASNKYGVFITDNPGTYYIANPSTFNMKGNIFYNPVISDNTSYDYIVMGNDNLIPIDATNRFINPNFVSTSTPDFHLNNTGVTNYASQRGVSGYLPTSDVTGASWAGANDVGCYANPTASTNPLVLNNLAAFVGDSIMAGTAGTAGNTEYNVFNTLTGKSVVTSGAGIGGEIIQGSRWLADNIAFTDAPDTIFYSIGVNNIYHGGGSVTPPNMTDQQAANEVATVMQKIAALGIKPIWLGAESGAGTPPSTLPNNTAIVDYNNKVQTLCATNSWTCGSILNQMMFNSNWWQTEANGGYYSNPDIFHDIHPTNAGHLLIGQLAEYLYYSHHTIGTDNINIGAGARIYANGQFRDLAATGSSVATLSITPQGGVGLFVANNDAFWIDVTNITWSNTDVHHKAWTESSTVSGLTNTIHTVGDLEANKYYNVKKDDVLGQNITGDNCTAGVCKADANGQITFTYTGTYTTHTFDVSEGDNLAPVTTATPAGGTYGTPRDITLSCADASGCGSTYYTTDGTTPTTSSSVYSTTPITISANTTLKFFSTDTVGNSETPKTETYIIDTTYPVTDITSNPILVTNSASAIFVFSANKTGSTFQCKLDTGSYASCTSPMTYTSLAEGSHTFTVQATDTLSHIEPSPPSFNWNIVFPNSGTHGSGRLIPNYVAPTATNPTNTPSKIIYNFSSTILKLGSKGNAVKELQRFLNNKLNLHLIIDGKLGPKTIAVIKKWQKMNGLVPDGLVGKLTKAKMNGGK